MQTPVPEPVAEQHRLLPLDAARGLALLGILLVNIQAFAEPFGRFFTPRPEADDLITQACFYFVKVFCEGKFFPLFSLMFGMGMILQRTSIERNAPPGAFTGIYLRRLFILLIFGALHALFLWYGDILFIYALAGFVLFLCSRFRARTMLIIAAVLLSISVILGGLAGGLQGLSNDWRSQAPATVPAETLPRPAAPPVDATIPAQPVQPEPVVSDAEPANPQPSRPRDGLDEIAERSPFFQLINAYRDQKIQGGPEEPLYIDLEAQAYRNGPWLDEFLFRAMTWLFFLFFSVFGFGWVVMVMFFIGAAMLKSDFFSPRQAPLRRALLAVGLCVGLPTAIAAAYLAGVKGSFIAGALAMAMLLLSGPLIAPAYLCLITLLAERNILAPVLRILAPVGRMALTNYLMHTVICTFIFYHWGLAQFGEWSRAERIGLAAAIFVAQCIISPLWLRFFRFGPMEWLWRTLTYLKLQPMLKTRPG